MFSCSRVINNDIFYFGVINFKVTIRNSPHSQKDIYNIHSLIYFEDLVYLVIHCLNTGVYAKEKIVNLEITSKEELKNAIDKLLEKFRNNLLEYFHICERQGESVMIFDIIDIMSKNKFDLLVGNKDTTINCDLQFNMFFVLINSLMITITGNGFYTHEDKLLDTIAGI